MDRFAEFALGVDLETSDYEIVIVLFDYSRASIPQVLCNDKRHRQLIRDCGMDAVAPEPRDFIAARYGARRAH